jgi:F-type H+-transporting ATPase subunit gamma
LQPRKLKKKLLSYIKFKELAKSIKLVALSQLSNLKKKISTRGIPLSSIIPFFDKKYYSPIFNTCLILPVGVDKSCCGPHNGNVFKRSEKLIDSLSDLNKTIGLFTIGNRTKDYFKKYYTSSLISNVYNIDKEPLSLTIAFILAEKILSKVYDKYYFVFNRYYTPFTQKTTLYEVAGLSAFYDVSLNRKNHVRKLTASEDFFNFIYKIDSGTLQHILDDIYYHSFSMVLLDTLEENEYSSLGARVTAMDNSTQNATKMIEVMSLLYNKARQASITNELIEIVSAANFVQ